MLDNMGPAHVATDPVFIEELQCEISRATRNPVILTNYDATACYDRIVPNLGMLVSQKYCVAASVTEMNAATLEHAEYRIRTELGLAEKGYSHTATNPIQWYWTRKCEFTSYLVFPLKLTF